MLSNAGTFQRCAEIFQSNTTLQEQYAYHGRTIGFANDPTIQTTYEGCLAVCGSGSDWYDWSSVSATLTTWILPVIGVLLQAPFESNETLKTTLLTFRWLGSPIVSIAYILWNIKVIGKCALMVDMSVPCGKTVKHPLDDSHEEEKSKNLKQYYDDMRDSLYILSAMNQFVMKLEVSTKEGTVSLRPDRVEQLLRMALFSADIKLRNPYGMEESQWRRLKADLDPRIVKTNDKSLRDIRRKIAENLRQHRRRAVVPVFVSTLWFLFAMGLSIQGAFGVLGENLEAHNLALGLFLSWLPVLVLATIVDRNFVAVNHAQDQLNKLVDAVVKAWTPFGSSPEEEVCIQQNMVAYVTTFGSERDPQEQKALTERAQKAKEECNNMREHRLFIKFAGQGRIRWHYGCAHSILQSIERSYIGAHRRPWLIDESEARLWLVLGNPTDKPFEFDKRDVFQIVIAAVIVWGTVAGGFTISFFTPTVGLGCRSGSHMIFAINATFLALVEFFTWAFTRANSRFRLPVEKLLMLGEFLNTVWLSYTIMAQTIGQEERCECLTSSWSSMGGYIDWHQYHLARPPIVYISWPVGTSLGLIVMGLSLIWIVTQWCLQSHLSTEHYESSQLGLWRVRLFRYVTQPFRHPFQDAYNLVFNRKRPVHTNNLPTSQPRMQSAAARASSVQEDDEYRATNLRWQWASEPQGRRLRRVLTGIDPSVGNESSSPASDTVRKDSTTALQPSTRSVQAYGAMRTELDQVQAPASASRVPRPRAPSLLVLNVEGINEAAVLDTDFPTSSSAQRSKPHQRRTSSQNSYRSSSPLLAGTSDPPTPLSDLGPGRGSLTGSLTPELHSGRPRSDTAISSHSSCSGSTEPPESGSGSGLRPTSG